MQSYETHQSSLYHRSYKYFFVQKLTFVTFDALILGPAILFLTSYLWKTLNLRIRFAATLIVLLTPLDVHVDHSNPQVNFIPLSFFLIAVRFSLSSHFALSACFATLALLSKVTVICVLPPFAVFVLARLYSQHHLTILKKFLVLLGITIAMAVPFVVINYPLLKQGTFYSLLDKIFPFIRPPPGQNIPTFWNTINLFLRVDKLSPTSQKVKALRQIATFLTLVGCIPPLIALARKPNMRRFLLAFQLCTISFFQFNYYFHEKSLLFLAIPMSLSILETPVHSYLLGNLLCVCSARFVIKQSQMQFLFYTLILLTLGLAKLHSKIPQKQHPGGLLNYSFLNFKIGSLCNFMVLMTTMIHEIFENFFTMPNPVSARYVKFYFFALFFPFLALWADGLWRIFQNEREEKSHRAVH